MQKLSVYLKQPQRAIAGALTVSARIWPDKPYLSMLYRARFGHRLDWENPRTFSEKLNWLKLYHRLDKYTQMADKYEAKQLVSRVLGGVNM